MIVFNASDAAPDIDGGQRNPEQQRGNDALLTGFSQAHLIRVAGGATSIARRLNLHRTTVQRWKITGIPACHYVAVARLARDAGFPVTAEEIEAMPTGGSNAA